MGRLSAIQTGTRSIARIATLKSQGKKLKTSLVSAAAKSSGRRIRRRNNIVKELVKMKKTFAVFVGIEGAYVGNVTAHSDDYYLALEDMSLKGSEGYRDIKVGNVEIDLPIDDVDELVALGREKIKEEALKAIEAKKAEVSAMEAAFKASFPGEESQAA